MQSFWVYDNNLIPAQINIRLYAMKSSLLFSQVLHGSARFLKDHKRKKERKKEEKKKAFTIKSFIYDSFEQQQSKETEKKQVLRNSRGHSWPNDVTASQSAFIISSQSQTRDPGHSDGWDIGNSMQITSRSEAWWPVDCPAAEDADERLAGGAWAGLLDHGSRCLLIWGVCL